MGARQMLENRKYIIAKDDFDRVFYAVKRRGLISIWVNVEGEDRRVLDEDYIDVDLFFKKRYSWGGLLSCYLILRNKDDECFIVDIISLEVVKKFDFQELMKKHKRKISEDEEDGEGIQDSVIILCNKEKKVYSIWSLFKGYIFEPYEYTTIELYSEGVILDGKIAVDNDGCKMDISSYDNLYAPVYYCKETDDYLFLVDEDSTLFRWMERNEREENIFEIETKHYKYTFNTDTQKLDCKPLPPDHYYDWSKDSDIAYEGYSRLYLGLED